MSAGPPVQRVNIRKAVTRGATYEGALSAAELQQFEDVLANGETLHVRAVFGRDEEGRQVVDLAVSANATLVCQRCLGNITTPVHSESRLGLVLTDEQAQSLPKEYEPWIALEEADLWAMASEELALALPVVAYHAPGLCSPPADPGAADAPDEAQEKDNPFNVLSELLSSNDKQEK
jgi:uncharacterized protein